MIHLESSGILLDSLSSEAADREIALLRSPASARRSSMRARHRAKADSRTAFCLGCDFIARFPALHVCQRAIANRAAANHRLTEAASPRAGCAAV